MTTDTEISPQEQAQQIWDQLDREDGGTPAATAASSSQHPEQQVSQPAAQEPVELHNDVSTDSEAQTQASPDAQELLDRIAGLEAMVQQQASRLRQAEGHIGGLNSQLKQSIQAAQRVTSQGHEAPSAQQIAEAQRSPEAMARLKEDYPEFGAAMESALNERLSQIEQRLQASVPQQQPVQQGVSAQDIERMRSELMVEVSHPGWQETVREPAFVGWLRRQPPEVQLLAASDSPRDAIRLLDLYGDGRATTNQRSQRLSSAAALPSGRASGASRQKSVDDMTPEEYWRYLDQQDLAKAKGL